ncbi:MAG: ATP-binding cassette domain-containing protein [Magnetococcales bacterium]|nr:ATP-binding cassette domain-containing protein [Magnetococcales bacterium]
MNRLRVEQLRTCINPPLTFQVEAGACVTLQGPSGCGKSLLLRALVDLDPNEGEVWLGERARNTTPPTEWRRALGYLAPESRWWLDRVGEHFSHQGETISALFTELGLPTEALDWQVARLSSGERQRCALARMLAVEPCGLLLDEPTANLDPASTQLVERLVMAYIKHHNAPLLWVSHDPEQVQRLAGRALHFNAEGSLQEGPLS